MFKTKLYQEYFDIIYNLKKDYFKEKIIFKGKIELNINLF